MSDQCPKCGAAEYNATDNPIRNRHFACMTAIRKGELEQSDICRIKELESEHTRLSQELIGMTQERDYARFAPLGDNHHNALACPYCSPKYREIQERLTAFESENARLRTYVEHAPDCKLQRVTDWEKQYVCTCGLDELLQPTKGETPDA